MKIKKNRLNVLKLYLITKKSFKLFLSKKNLQLINIKLFELQLKKSLKLFFKICLQKWKSRDVFIFFHFLSQIFKKITKIEKKSIRLGLFYELLQKINSNLFSSIFKSNFLQIFCYFLKIYSKNIKISGNLTHIIFYTNIKNFKKINFYYYYNYSIFWNTNKNIKFYLLFLYYSINKIKNLYFKNKTK
jgi:hypothetical protein